MSTKSRISELESRITAANTAYYNEEPIISDGEFDALRDELKELDPNNKLLVAVGAATEDSHWEKMAHKIPMGSQDKVNSIDEFLKWASNRGVADAEFSVQEKLDGISISLNYANGSLQSAVTRGDGLIGEDIYRNAVKMKGVMSNLKVPFTGYIRGEVILLKSDWEQHMSDLANPRNAASGISRRITGGGQEHLTVVCYDMVSSGLTKIMTEAEKITEIMVLGLNGAQNYVVKSNEISALYEEYINSKLGQLDYDIDGLVIKVNNLGDQNKLNSTADDSRNPKGQVALKFAHEMRESVITDVIWQVGGTGRITPVAIIAPVKISGVMISKASLHNVANVKRLGVKIGAKALISRRNAVIPYCEQILDGGDKDVEIPTTCPMCQQLLIQNGEYIQCMNEDCRLAGNLEKWIAVTEIENVGPKMVEALVESGLVQTPADLYKITESDVRTLDRMGERSSEKIIYNIQQKKVLPLHIFLAGLNIPSCGRRVFKSLIAGGYDTLEKIQKAKFEEVRSIDRLGLIIARLLVDGLVKKKDIIKDLLSAGIVIVEKEVEATGGLKLSGLSFCFTGTMTNPRTALESMATSNGGDIGSVSNGLTYLVAADPDSGSSKMKKALKLGVKIISEKEFLEMI